MLKCVKAIVLFVSVAAFQRLCTLRGRSWARPGTLRVPYARRHRRGVESGADREDARRS